MSAPPPPADREDSATRIDRLESKITHVERLAEQLNEVVTEQGRQLDRLTKLAQRLAKLVESQELDRIQSTNAKPPHYQ
jgi:SlyX protein